MRGRTTKFTSTGYKSISTAMSTAWETYLKAIHKYKEKFKPDTERTFKSYMLRNGTPESDLDRRWKEHVQYDARDNKGWQHILPKTPQVGIDANKFLGNNLPTNDEILQQIDREARIRIIEEQWEDAIEERVEYLKDEQERRMLEQINRHVTYEVPYGIG